MTEGQPLLTPRHGTWRLAWDTLSKVHALLTSDPVTRSLADDVFATMLKLDIVHRAAARAAQAAQAFGQVLRAPGRYRKRKSTPP